MKGVIIMKIKKVLYTPIATGYYMDDKEAIQKGASQDLFNYPGTPLTPGFKRIRQPGEGVSIIFELENGDIAYGDCTVAQYSASGGREVPLSTKDLMRIIQREVVPRFEGKYLFSFRGDSSEIDKLHLEGFKLPATIRYGVTQAILKTIAKKRRCTMAEVVADEYNLELNPIPIKISTQSGDDRYVNVDKMILKQADMMPHGLINSVSEKLGTNGETFLHYVSWVKKRVLEIGDAGYNPILMFDVYGCIGKAFNNDFDKVTEYLLEVEKRCKPFEVFIEMPIDMGTKQEQLQGMKYLREKLNSKGSNLKLTIDEYANTLEDIKEWVDLKGADMIHIKTVDLGGINNTVEAVLYCKEKGTLAYLGGTCNETENSAKACINIGLATQPFVMLAKPGMDVDTPLMIFNNEQERLIQIIQARKMESLMQKAGNRC